MLISPIKLKIKELCKTAEGEAESYQEIEQLLRDHLANYPTDSAAHLSLCCHIYQTRRIDTLDIIDCVTDLLKYEPDNIYALLFIAFVQRYEIAKIDNALFDKLIEYKTQNREVMAMIAIAISWYYELKVFRSKEYEKDQEQWLKKSIEYCPDIVLNYYELLLFYFYKGQLDEYRELIPFALKNIIHVFNENRWEDDLFLDSTDFEGFLNRRYRYTHVFRNFVDDLESWQDGRETPYFRSVIIS